MYNQELESLMDTLLEDGVLTDKKKEVLLKKARSYSVDPDEFEMVIETRARKFAEKREQELNHSSIMSQPYENYSYSTKKVQAPYNILSLILGISSFVLPWLFLIGLCLSILGFIFSNKGLSVCQKQEFLYEGVNMLRIGRTFSIVGMVLSGITTLIGIITFIAAGTFGFGLLGLANMFDSL